MTLRWQAVVGLLDESPANVPAVARATIEAAEGHLRALSRDPSIGYCFWLLTRVSWASRSADFQAALSDLGLSARETDSALTFISQLSDRVRAELVRYPASGPFSEIASLALRRALSETVGQEGRSLFGTSLEDLQAAFRRYSSPMRFSALAKSFFGDFLSRTLRFFVEKELSNNVGAGHRLTGVEASREFTAGLDLYARQSARIMEEFAGGWYGKHNWESKGQIGREEAQRFVAVALTKLRMELSRSQP